MADGLLIDQRFRLGRVVRESGISIVYEARHRNGADAWIKLPRAQEHAAALLREAQVANALGSRAVNVRDDGKTKDGLPYLVLEPVTGQRLDHWRASSGGRAPADDAIGLGDELCQAIEAMHGAGFSIGLLRTDAILVLPKGGVCLLELEHVKAATEATMKEDVVRVGRVLYEVLSGVPCLPNSPPLRVAAPELPRAMASIVDDAARGRLRMIKELHASLRRSIPEELGPPRLPTPSMPHEVIEGGSASELEAFVLPRASKPLFDPGDVVDSSRDVTRASVDDVDRAANVDSAPLRPIATSEGGARGTSLERSEPRALGRLRGGGLVVAGATASALFVAAIGVAVVVFVLKGDRSASGVRASPVVALAAVNERVNVPSEGASPSANAKESNGRRSEVIDVDAGVSGDASLDAGNASLSAHAPSAVPGAGETAFRFEGDLSPRFVIVDGIAVGVTTKELRVRCGRHSVKVGGKGVARPIDLPCDGEQRIVVERNGSWQAL